MGYTINTCLDFHYNPYCLQMMFSDINPFIYGEQGEVTGVKSTVVNFTLSNCDPNSTAKPRVRRAATEDDSFKIGLKVKPQEAYYINSTLERPEILALHILNASDTSPNPATVTIYPAHWNESLDVYIRVGDNPTMEEYDNHFVVPDPDKNISETEVSLNKMTIYIPAANLTNDTTGYTNSLHVGIQSTSEL